MVLIFSFLLVQTIILNAQELNILQSHISNENYSVKQIRTKHRVRIKHASNNLTVVKFALKNKMSTKEQAKKENISQNFIKNIRFLEDDKVIYNAILTPYISAYPTLKFKYYGNSSSVLRLETIDNNNKFEQQDNKIKMGNKPINLITIKKVKESNQSIKYYSYLLGYKK